MNDGPDATEHPNVAAPRSTRDGLRRSLTYFATVAVGQGLAFFLLPFITRAMPAAAYGEYTLALVVSTLVGMVASSWVRNVSMRLYFDAVDRGVGRGFFLGTVGIQAVFFTVLYAATLTTMAAVGYVLAPWSVMVRAGLTVLVGDLAVYAATLLRAERRAGAFAAAELGGGALRIGATLAGLAVGFRSAELLFDATTLGYALGAAIAVPALWRRLTGPVRIDRVGTGEVLRHGPAALPFSVAGWIERLADRLVLESFLGTAVVGIYSVGYTVGERTMGTLAKAVFMMAWPNVLAAWSQGGTPAARVAVREAQVLYLWFTTGPVVFLIAYGAALMRWFTGAEYHDSAQLVPIIAASMWIGGYATYLNRHLELGKRFGTLSAITMAGALVNVALNLWLVPRFGMPGAAWSTMINRLINVTVFYAIRDRALVSIPVGAIARAVAWSLALWLATAWLPLADTLRMVAFVAGYAPVALLAMRRVRG